MEYSERFTERGQRALLAAQKEARQLGRSYVGTEHLLLGVLTDPGAAKGVVGSITLDSARNEIIAMLGRSSTPSPEQINFTPRTKKVIEQSMSEARELKQNYVSVEHLLLALMREREGVAAHVLIKMGLDLSKAREELLRLLSGDNTAAESTEGEECATPVLDSYSRDLTKAARGGELDPVVGRENEIERILQILSRRRKNNPVLIGEPGVGKSAIVEGLAQRIADGNVPEPLQGNRVVSLDLASMLAGAKYRGEFEERLKNALGEIEKSRKIIVFIDELHTIVGAGASEGSIDAANILKPMLARGEIRCIGATTQNEYRKHIEKDGALERRFQPVKVEAPSPEVCVEILRGVRDRYEAHHRVHIPDDAIEAAVALSTRYIPDRSLPDKAIDLIDEAASRVRLKAYTTSPDMQQQQQRLTALSKEIEEAVSHQDFEKAAGLRDNKKQLQDEMKRDRDAWQRERSGFTPTITKEDVAQLVSMLTGVPAGSMNEGEAERLLKLEEKLHERVIGQKEAVGALARAVRRSRAGLKDPNRPIGSFIFLGPTGVGKTELCKALGAALFGDEDSVIRIDMSEYMEKFSVSRMIGSPPGYVGHDEGGQLTERVRRKPYSVVLFDEVEKAHPDVIDLLLQILEDGRLTDSLGRVVDFKNTVIVMTGNVGADLMRRQRTVGFGEGKVETQDHERMTNDIMSEVRRRFRPEFLNRVDEIIVFHALTDEELLSITQLLLDNVVSRLKARNITLTFDEEAAKLIAKQGSDTRYGARPIRRAIQRMVEDALSDDILSGVIREGDHVLAGVREDSLSFTPVCEGV